MREPNQIRITPTLCRHRDQPKRYVHMPPAFVRVLMALHSGRKGDRTGTVGTVAQVAKRLKMSRQRAAKLVNEALENGALDRPFGPASGIYRKSSWGKQLLQTWIKAGWTPQDKAVSQERTRRTE